MKRIIYIACFSVVLFACEKAVIQPKSSETDSQSCSSCAVKGGANPNIPSSGVDISNSTDIEAGITDPNKDKDESKRKGSN